jgi:hypothetical protein
VQGLIKNSLLHLESHPANICDQLQTEADPDVSSHLINQDIPSNPHRLEALWVVEFQ